MAHTRTVFATFEEADGTPWPDFEVEFIIDPAAITSHSVLPYNAITVKTNEDGYLAVDLEVGVQYIVGFKGAYTPIGKSAWNYHPERKLRRKLVVPDGDGPISLMTIWASEISPTEDPTLVNMVAQVASDLSDHEADDDNPHSVTAGQTGAYTTTETDDLIDDVLAVPDPTGHTNEYLVSDGTDAAWATVQADDVNDSGSSVHKFVTAEEITKLANIAEGATANSTDAELRDRATHTGTQPASTISDFADAADARIANAAGDSIASLTGGKIPSSQLPALAVVEVSTVASEAAMLALTAQAGDMAIRSDLSQTYVHNGGTTGTVADWTLLDTPTDAVTSVNGQTGTVVLGKGDVGLGNADNTSDASKPVSDATQTALDGKVDDDDADYLANTAARHTHANMDALDDVTDARLVPSGGAWYQVLRVGADGPEWADPSAPVPLAVVTPTMSADRDGPLEPVIADSITIETGAWRLIEGTVNLASNPVFFANSTTGVLGNAGVGISHETLDTYMGPGALRLVFEGSTAYAGAELSSIFLSYPASERIFTAWLIIKGSGVIRDTFLRAWQDESRKAFDSPRKDITLTDDWAIIPYHITTNAAYTIDRIGVACVDAPGTSTATAIIGGYMIVEGSYIGEFCPQFAANGDLLPGYTWTGSPNVSASTRVAASIIIPHATRPASILIRHRSAGITATSHVQLDGSDVATFGPDGVGVITWANGTLTVATTDADIGHMREIKVMGVATFAEALPACDGAILTPQTWTLSHLPVMCVPSYPTLPTTIGGYWPTNATIATGGATLRTAPGTSTQAITTLTAGTVVHDTGTVLSVSSVDYALLWTDYGQGWVPASTITS